MRKGLLRILALAATLALGAPAAAIAQVPTPGVLYAPKGPIEAKYVQPGPWAISQVRTTDSCDRKGNVCTIYYPSDLGSNPIKGWKRGFTHPVISWANGTGTPSSGFQTILRHWASWGFVVVATEDRDTGFGETVADAAEYLIALGSNRQSPFYRKLDPSRVGVSGQSQGGAAALGLFVRRPDLFKTAVTYAPVSVPLGLVLNWTNPIDLTKVSSGSILYIGGALDPIADPASLLTYYLTTSNNVGKALGILSTSSHNDMVVGETCETANCFTGRGYPTAWMMWKLQDAADGEEAFRAGSGEFSQAHPLWAVSLSNGK